MNIRIIKHVPFEGANLLIKNCKDELDNSAYIQTESEMFLNKDRFININKIMDSLLNALSLPI